jgi:hypothetical protein
LDEFLSKSGAPFFSHTIVLVHYLIPLTCSREKHYVRRWYPSAAKLPIYIKKNLKNKNIYGANATF